MRWLTPSQVSEKTGFAEKTLANWRSMNVGPPWRKIGRLVRYDEVEVERWMREQEKR